MGARVPPDVPVHRPSVGADPTNMGTLMPDNFYENFKPYVYRGTGVDTLTPHIGEDWERGKGQPEPETNTRKRTKARKRRPKPRPQYRPAYYLPPPTPEMVAEQDRITRLQAKHEAQRMLDTYYVVPEAEPSPWPFPTKNARPSPGWQPMKGDDIDALLDELSD